MAAKLNSYKNYELRFGRDTLPYRVFATWNIHYACNYKCSYCHAPKPEHKDVRKAAYIKTDLWIDIWKKMYERYGTWELLISGGEPFAYPGFMDMLIALSKIHIVGVCTNLNWDAAYFVKHIGPQRVRIETSFHPEFADLDNFVGKLKILKQHGFEPTVNFVPWPPLLEKMRKVKEAVELSGCQLTLQPFIGQFENRSYPQGYTEQEKTYFKIFKDECNLKTLDFKTTKESDSTKGKLCRMGQNYVFIHPDGDVSRCCRDHSFSLGNIIEGSFELFEEPAVCNAQNCNCWRCMLVEKEEFWRRHWGRGEISDLAMAERRIKKTNFEVSLIQPPVWGIFEPPVALAQISSCLKKAGYEVSVFDLNIEFYTRRKEEYNTVWAIEQSSFWGSEDNVKRFFEDNCQLIEEQVNKIIDSNPGLIGFSVNVCSLPAAIVLAERIKRKIPQVKIVIGGPMFFVSADISGILKHDCIDIIVYGEGEETFCELPEFFLKGKDLHACRGIYFKEEGRVVKTEARSAIKNLDTLPFLDLSSFPLDKYDPPGHLGRHISLMTSRGCVLNCVYCGPKAYWQGFRFMSGQRIYEEVKYHIQHDPVVERIEFLDLELNGNIKALSDFCDLMIADHPKQGIKWHANIVIRPEMTKELLLKMKQAGCDHLSIGIETGSQRVLGLMNKRYKIEDADMVLKNARDAGIVVTTNFMFGFPGEREEDFDSTLDFLRRNAESIGTVYPSRTFCTIEPFSYLSEHLGEFGMVVDPVYNLYWESEDGKNNYPERLRRCEEFSKLAMKLGVPVGLGLQTSLDLDRYYNLGFYYEYKKDFEKARSFFENYLKLDPKNTIINKKIQELSVKEPKTDSLENAKGEPKDHDNCQISFNWDITSICNYRCPYCWFYGKWVQMSGRNRNISASELEAFWGKMYDKYGPIKIFITGGEPFLFPSFIDLIYAITRWHRVEVVTNLFWAVKPVIERIQSLNIKIHPSFHPLFADFSDFVDKLVLLKKKGLANNPSFVAWPPQISHIDYYAKKFKDYGMEMFVQSFFGEYNGVRYPDGYSDTQRQTLMPYLGERGGKPFQISAYPTKGKLCYAGCRYGVIHPDGTVLRCGGLNSEDAKVGNITDKDFKLLGEARPCMAETCPCNEWAFLLKES